MLVLSFGYLSSGTTLDLGKGVSFAPSLGTPITPKAGYSVLSAMFKIRTMYPEGKKHIEDKVVEWVDQHMIPFMLQLNSSRNQYNCPYLTNLYKTGNTALEAIQNSPTLLLIPKLVVYLEKLINYWLWETKVLFGQNLHSFFVLKVVNLTSLKCCRPIVT